MTQNRRALTVAGAKEVARNANAPTDALNTQGLDHLAAMAEEEGKRKGRKRRMNGRSRLRFDYLIADAHEYWHSRAKSLAQTPRIENFKNLRADARSLTKRISNLLSDNEALSALNEAARQLPDRNTDKRYIRDCDEGTTIFGRLYAIRDRLFIWSELLGIVVDGKLLPQPQRKRPDSDGSFVAVVYCLSEAWKIGSGQDAGTSSDYVTNQRRGPFVRFVREAMRSIDPDGINSGPSGDSIGNALGKIASSGRQRHK